ncbi:MAG: ferritin-like domain-containing protein [Armatimonadetes bacterium]|nr:ferritin-like domain-containing protein [Armatimonadota bacterium]
MDKGDTLASPIDRPMEGPVSRRSLLRTLGGGAALTAAGLILSGCGGDDEHTFIPGPGNGNGSGNGGGGISQSVMDVLNFALQLEYLEATFYSFAVTGNDIPANITTGAGAQGAVSGGAKAPLSDSLIAATAQELYQDEVNHVVLLRSVLGAQAVARPAINLAALGVGFGSEAEFLGVARALEDTGVAAYGGALGALLGSSVVDTAARIFGVEAYHAGNIRYQAVARGVNSPVNPIGQPPSVNNLIPTTDNGLTVTLSPQQVINIVKAFFPNGLNGNIK